MAIIKNEPLVSVIIPVYKVERYITRCIESVLNQTYKNLEIILIDDGSPDKCGEICDAYAKADGRIQVIHKKNGGLSDARNVGIEAAQGDYITCVDSDDYISIYYVENLYQCLFENGADISVCSHKKVYEEEFTIPVQSKFCNSLLSKEEFFKKMLLEKEVTCSAWGNLVKSTYYEGVRFPKGKFYEDLATTYKLYDKAEKIAVTTEKLYFYYIRSGSQQNEKFSLNQMDAIEYSKELLEFINQKYPTVSDAAMSKYISNCFHVLFFSDNICNYCDIKKQLIKEIKKNRKNVIIKKDVSRKVRGACICSYFGFSFTKWVFDKFGLKGGSV